MSVVRVSACCLQKSQIQQFSPSNTSQQNLANLAVSIRNIFNKVSFPKIAFSNPSQLYIYYHRTVFQVQVHVFPEKRLGTVQTKILHASTSPVKFFIRYATPALFANGQFLPFEENVKFNVLAFTLIFPRILTMFQPCESPVLLVLNIERENCF